MSNKKQTKPQDIDARAVVDDISDDAENSENNEQSSAQNAAADNDSTAENYGKFSSLQELLNAYNALQSEFTKRCQLIKQLQARLDEGDAQAQAGAAAEMITESAERNEAPCASNITADTVARSSVCDGEARLAEAVAVIAENIDECADYLASLPQIADAVILTYKKKLLGNRTAVSPRGMAVVMPAMRPKTLADAKRLADEILKS